MEEEKVAYFNDLTEQFKIRPNTKQDKIINTKDNNIFNDKMDIDSIVRINDNDYSEISVKSNSNYVKYSILIINHRRIIFQ